MVHLHTLGASSVDFVVRPWVKVDNYWDVYWDVTRTVKLRFDKEGISIPFPQRDVHIYHAEALAPAEASPLHLQPAKKYIVDLNILNSYNKKGCEACNQKFNLGDTVVMACGDWAGGPRYVHENEAVFDPASGTYMERSCYEAARKG